MNQDRVVVFDLGNVLLTWDVDAILASLQLDEHSTNCLRSELFQHQHWLDLDHGKDTEQSVTDQLCQRSSLSAESVQAALLAAKTSLCVIEDSLSLMTEIADKGIPIYCLSNMSRETYAHIQSYAFFDLFDGILISGIERCMKPDREIFELLLQRFSLTAQKTLFIDDSMDNIEAAMKLGISAYHFKGDKSCYSNIRRLLY